MVEHLRIEYHSTLVCPYNKIIRGLKNYKWKDLLLSHIKGFVISSAYEESEGKPSPEKSIICVISEILVTFSFIPDFYIVIFQLKMVPSSPLPHLRLTKIHIPNLVVVHFYHYHRIFNPIFKPYVGPFQGKTFLNQST